MFDNGASDLHGNPVAIMSIAPIVSVVVAISVTAVIGVAAIFTAVISVATISLTAVPM